MADTTHDSPIEGLGASVEWEPLGSCDPQDLPDGPSALYPGPWTSHGRGNGHVDIFDANGRYFAHVLCGWVAGDWELLAEKIKNSND